MIAGVIPACKRLAAIVGVDEVVGKGMVQRLMSKRMPREENLTKSCDSPSHGPGTVSPLLWQKRRE